jgi:hypothetical protein
MADRSAGVSGSSASMWGFYLVQPVGRAAGMLPRR